MASDNVNSEVGRRYRTLPSSAVVRPAPARRARATIASNPPQIGEENAIYPVFNPLDPRHNPTAPASSWIDDAYYSREVPNNPCSEGWMQSLSRRSIRKARSSLLALRSGMQRRPLDGSPCNDEMQRSYPWPEEYSDQKENMFPSTVSEASTEEDIEFGSHLHRTNCKSSPLALGQDRPMPKSRFSSALADFSPFTRKSEEAPEPSKTALMELTPSTGVHASASKIAGESAPLSRENGPRGFFTPDGPTEDHEASSRPRSSIRNSAGSNYSRVTTADSTVLAHTSSGVEGSDVDRVEDYLRCVARPSLDSTLSGSDKATSHTGEAGEVIHNEDIVTSVHLPEPNIVDVSDIDLMMDTLGALDRLNTLDSPDISRVDPNSHGSSPGSPGPTNTEVIRSSRLTNERDLRRSNREAQSQSNGSCNIRIQVQSGDWSRSLSPVPESTDLVDSNDFFGDQAAWSNRPSEEGTTTDITSVSNALWSPVEHEDQGSSVSLGDEYFLVDGKTSGFHPDRGGNPTKAERTLIRDDSVYSNASVQRNPSVRTLDIPEVIGPTNPMPLPPPGLQRRDRDASDSTDEYLTTYPLFLRRYLSDVPNN